MKHTIIRIIITVIAIIALIYLGFIASLFLLSPVRQFLYLLHHPPNCITGIVVIVWATGKFRKKTLAITFAAIIGTALLSSGTYHLHQMYLDSIPEMNEGDNLLYKYQPFDESPDSRFWDETPTLQFTDSLPRIHGAKALYPLYAAFVQSVYPNPEQIQFPVHYDDPLLGYWHQYL